MNKKINGAPRTHARYCNTSRQATIAFLLSLGSVIPAVACGQQETAEDPTVHSTLAGILTVRPEVDPTPDYRGFEILVAVDRAGEPDTLGYAATDSTGVFSMDITAPGRGIYALIISRNGEILKIGEIAIAEGDSASLQAAFPVGNRLLRVRSPENAAWMGYQNAKAQHNKNLLDLVQSGAYDDAGARAQVEQTSGMLWNMQHTFPGTMGAEVAASESVLMLAGWNDSVAVARALQVVPEDIQYVEVARAARQSVARLSGQEAAVTFLQDAIDRAIEPEQSAELQAELVVAHMDSLDYVLARELARKMQNIYAETAWVTWAERALYELDNLLPGMAAPPFTVRTVEGDSLHLEGLRGKPVVLEFFQPQDAVYQREYEGRNSLLAESDAIHVVSISLEPDTLINEALFEERDARGTFVYAQHRFATDVARQYNVNVLPTRFLIDGSGNLVGKYVGGAMAALREDALALAGI